MSTAPSRFTSSSTILACLLIGAMVGCSDNPVKPLPSGPKYLASSTPQNTLENLRRAYTTRDTTGYDSLFDAAYIGTSIDQRDPSPTLKMFTKGDEALHIRALAEGSISVSRLQFPPSLIRTSDAADTLGWATIPISFVFLEIEDFSVGTSWVISPDDVMEFKFRPTTPSPGSPTDTTWHIVRWSEVQP
jgi:hypothetical protein